MLHQLAKAPTGDSIISNFVEASNPFDVLQMNL
jgi:hypothetical protein